MHEHTHTHIICTRWE